MRELKFRYDHDEQRWYKELELRQNGEARYYPCPVEEALAARAVQLTTELAPEMSRATETQATNIRLITELVELAENSATPKAASRRHYFTKAA